MRRLPKHLHVRLAFALAATSLAIACDEIPASPSLDDAPKNNDGGACDGAEEGCPCTGGEEPELCFQPAQPAGDHVMCEQGTRTCVNGTWGRCESVWSYTIRTPKLLGTPTACNVCDPACTTHTTTPGASDLTPSNSSNVVFVPGTGVSLDNLGTTPGGGGLADSDGDGYPDVVDDCNGPGVRAPCNGNPYSVIEDGFVFQLAYGSSASAAYPNINLELKSADVYVLQDASGSMDGEIANIRSNLTSGTIGVGSTCAAGMNGGLVGAIRCAIPNSEFGSGMTREYPRSSIGDDYQTPFTPLLDITSSLSVAQSIINAYTVQGNSQGWPEATGQALYAIGSGRGLGPWLPDRGTCPNGGRGYPCFRTNAIPIVLVITDAPFNNGPSGNAYSSNYTMSGMNLPQVVTLDQAGRTVRVAETAATAFNLGDLTTRSVTVSGTTAGMANDYTLPSSACGTSSTAGNGPDAVFIFTLTQPTRLRIRTEGSDYDGMIALRTTAFASSTAAGNIIACNDDAGGLDDANGNEVYDYAANVVANLAAGTYYIQMDGYGSGNSGAFQMRIFNETVTSNGMSTTPSITRTWAQTTAALNSIGAKTIGVATCDCAQGALTYPSCRASNAPTGSFCLAAYNRCVQSGSTPWSSNNTTRCTALRNACAASVTAEASAPSSCTLGASGPRTRACTAALNYCTSNGGTLTRCTAVQTSCNAEPDPCSSNVSSYCSCATTTNDCYETINDLRTLGTATSSVSSAGTPFVYGAAENGSGLSALIVDAVVDLAAYLALDVDVVCVDNPMTALNECTAFNVSVAPTPNCPATCTGGRSGNACLDCAPGTTFNFQVNVTNVGVMQTMVPQVFTFDLVARADATTELLRVPVRVVVPPIPPMPQPQSGYFQHLYDSTLRCTPPSRRPLWQTLNHDVVLPPNTRIDFQIRVADSAAGIASATPYVVTTTSAAMAANPINLATLLSLVDRHRPYLQVRVVLSSNPGGTVGPALRSFRLEYDCVDFE